MQERLAGSTDPRDRPLLDLAWDYPTEGETADPSPEAVLREINGWGPDGKALSAYTELKDDGSTTARLLDLHRRLRRRGQPVRPPQARPRAEHRRARVGLGVAGQPPDPLQPRLGRPRRQAVERAQEVRLVGRGGRQVDRRRRARLRAEQAAGLRAAGGRDRAGRDRRHRPVHHAERREGVAVRAGGPGRRADAGALRAGRVAGPQRALRAAVQPDAARSSRPRTTAPTPSADDVYPYVFTTYRLTEHHTAGGMSRHAALPGRAAAGVLHRGLPAAGRGARAGERRLGDGRHGARGGGGAGAGDRADPAAAGRRADRPPGRRALSLGRRGHLHRRLGQRPDRRGHGPERAHPGEKAATCDVRPGRRPRGPALVEYVEGYRQRAGVRPGSCRSAAGCRRRPVPATRIGARRCIEAQRRGGGRA